MKNPIESMCESIYSALITDLPDLSYQNPNGSKTIVRRPRIEDVSVCQFVQTWGTTSLGFGGIGGQAFTSAYVTTVACMVANKCAVYFGGRLAYLADSDNQNFVKDFYDQQMADVSASHKYQTQKP